MWHNKPLCRWDLPSVTLQLDPDVEHGQADGQQRTSWTQLERQLEQEAVTKEYPPWADHHWLKCQAQPTETTPLLGVAQQGFNQREPDPPVVHIYYYRTSLASNVPPSDQCTCPLPHSDWKLSIVHDTLSTSTSTAHVPTVHWIRTNHIPQQPAQIVHFLRSLLGVDHRASPWVQQDQILRNNTTVILETNQLEHPLWHFRISDACPSWYGHVRLVQSDTCRYIVRILPPRTQLSTTFQTIHAEPGCLWEYPDNTTATTTTTNSPNEVKLLPHLVAPPYFPVMDLFPCSIPPLLQQVDVLRQEINAIPKTHWLAWPEQQHYKSERSPEDAWTVLPLCYCFPANDASKRVWVEATTKYFPKTTQLLQTLLGEQLRTALWSRLAPQTTLQAHTGWADLANHVLRVHVPVIVPEGNLCGTWVDGCVETTREHHVVALDDSKIHRAFNYADRERIVLILDLARPPGWPLGTATGGHSSELDDLIVYMSPRS